MESFIEEYGQISYPVIGFLVYQTVKQLKERCILDGNNLFFAAVGLGIILCAAYEIGANGLSVLTVLTGIANGALIAFAASGYYEMTKPASGEAPPL